MFEFENEQHIAMVTVCEEQAGSSKYQVQLFNQEFYHLIPDGKFNYSSVDNSLPAPIKNQAAEALLFAVQAAINMHLHLRPTTAEELINTVKHDSDRDTQL